MQQNASAVGLLHAIWAVCACLRWSQNVRRLNDSLLPRRLWPAGPQRVGKEVLELLPQSPAMTATQTSHAFIRWTVTTCLAWLALWPSMCDTGGLRTMSVKSTVGSYPRMRKQPLLPQRAEHVVGM